MRAKHMEQQTLKFLMLLLTAVMFVVRRQVLYAVGTATRVYHAQCEFGAKHATVAKANYTFSMLTSAAGVGSPSSVEAAAPPVVGSSGGVSSMVVGAKGCDASDGSGGTQSVPSFPTAFFNSQYSL